MTFTSALTLKRSEQPPAKRLGEAVDALKAARAVKARAWYERPATAKDKAIAERIMGERGD